MTGPHVSVVVVVHNMPREATRSLYSLSADYQLHIDPDDYEVIVIDNGSNPPPDLHMVAGLTGNFRLIRIDPAPASPAPAVNRGLAEARGEIICVMVDGARIVTPGLVHFGRHGAGLHPNAVVAALGWYLGYDFQGPAIQYGYDRRREDDLLTSIGWPRDGYRLFEIGTQDQSSVEGWFRPISEANALFMRRGLWERLGGMDERFDAPGGGLVNLDLYARAVQLPDAQPVFLLGEGTFHQLHGGIATNASEEQLGNRLSEWLTQYERLRGRRWKPPQPERQPMYVGSLPAQALVHFVHAVLAADGGVARPPLLEAASNRRPLSSLARVVRAAAASARGRAGARAVSLSQRLQSPVMPERPADPVAAALVDLAQQEFAAGRYAVAAYVTRLIRRRAPDELEPQRLLSLTAGALDL